MRKSILIIWLVILFSGISYLFWHNEWKYSLPTPVPEKYKVVNAGDKIPVDSEIAPVNKPLFLHFFNPDCPCSRFNINHFRSLVKKYGHRINFAMVILEAEEDYTAGEIRDKYDLNIPVLFDKNLAEQCGVYSTPQAAIINTDQTLYYRGNYNKARYCIDKNTNYAQMAVDSLLSKRAVPTFSKAALKSYGCELPNCNK